jgi:hypothetical protein
MLIDPVLSTGAKCAKRLLRNAGEEKQKSVQDLRRHVVSSAVRV